MADAQPAHCAGNDPLLAQRTSVSASASASASPSPSPSPSPSLLSTVHNPHPPPLHQSHHPPSPRPRQAHDRPPPSSSSGFKDKAKGNQQQTPADQQLRKSASASTTASATTNTSTEARATVSNRASRSALTRDSLSPAASPAISFSSWHERDESDFAESYSHSHRHPHNQHHQHLQQPVLDHLHATGTAYQPQSAGSPPSTSFEPIDTSPGIVQVNPAPLSSSSPAPQQRGRPQMATSFVNSLFGRRRPGSSASSIHSSNFAAANPPPPGPSAFDFNNILQSLDNDTTVQADLDAIAEICGRSRLSLANAHANHRGPVGELTALETSGNPAMLETVREAGHGREDERRLSGSRAGSAAGEDRWEVAAGTHAHVDDRDAARQSPRGTSLSGVVAYGSSTRTEEEGRARRHLMRVRDVSNERDQRRQRR